MLVLSARTLPPHGRAAMPTPCRPMAAQLCPHPATPWPCGYTRTPPPRSYASTQLLPIATRLCLHSALPVATRLCLHSPLPVATRLRWYPVPVATRLHLHPALPVVTRLCLHSAPLWLSQHSAPPCSHAVMPALCSTTYYVCILPHQLCMHYIHPVRRCTHAHPKPIATGCAYTTASCQWFAYPLAYYRYSSLVIARGGRTCDIGHLKLCRQH